LEKEEKERERLRERKRKIEYILSICNIPKRYRNAKLEPKTKIQYETAQYLIENFSQQSLEKSSDVLLLGAIGTGKTYLSCAFALELIEKKQIFIKYTTEYELLALYFEKRYQEFRNFRETHILILDEIGKRVLSDWQRVQLEELLSYRYNELLPTIYITNLPQKAFKEFLGERLADRLHENRLKQFAFNGKSLRA